ncbi:hypothetical protein TNCV_1945701 [Trichonephila clavipes]|nr:hypothetical protein TNCV_1945701 [Trichonephila clavipes]
MKLIERLIEEGGGDSSSRNFVSPKMFENIVRLTGRHFPSYVESDCSKKKHRENVWYISNNEAIWRILNFSIHKRYPTVIHLSDHLENGQIVYVTKGNAAERAQFATINNFYCVLLSV